MASGSFNLTRTGSTSSYVSFKCTWSSTSNGSSANSSNVTIKITAYKSASSSTPTYGIYNASVSINGITKSVGNSNFSIPPGGSKQLLSTTVAVGHNADGSKSTSISASVGGDVMWGSGSSGTITLDKIPRYFSSNPKITLTSRNETTANFSWTTSENCSTVQYKINSGGSWVTVTNDANSKSGSFSINNLTPGTTYTIYGNFKRRDSGLWNTTSPSVGVSMYSYPKFSIVPEFIVGNPLSIEIYNPLSRECVLSIITDDDTEYENEVTTTGTTISGFDTQTWLDRWYSSLPTSSSGKYKVRLICNTGNINILSDETNYYLNTSDDSLKPVFTENDCIDIINTVNVNISGNNKFIKNHNSLSGVIKPMTPQKYTTGDYYNISSSGLPTVTKEYSESNINFVLGNLNSDTFNITAIDARGFSKTITKNIELIDYNIPEVIESKRIREDGVGETVIIYFKGEYTNWENLETDNIIQSIKYKIGDSEIWKNIPQNAELTSVDGIWTLNTSLEDTFDSSQQYDLYLQVSDLLETVEFGPYTISTADAFIWKDLANKQFGINKKPSHTLDVYGDANANEYYIQDNKIIWYENIEPDPDPDPEPEPEPSELDKLKAAVDLLTTELNALKNKTNVVYDYILGEDQQYIVINNGIDLKRDKIYDIEIIGTASETTDVFCWFNNYNDDTHYWMYGWATSKTLSAEYTGNGSDIVHGLRKDRLFFYWYHGLSSRSTRISATLTMAYDSIESKYYPRYDYSTRNVWSGSQLMSYATGVCTINLNQTNITSITYKADKGVIKKGTRIVITKRN